MNRYRVALAKGRNEYEKAIQDDSDLLKAFGMMMTSTDGGVHFIKEKAKGGRINPWDLMSVNFQMWDWLRPLLLELKDRREGEAELLRLKVAAN